MELKSILVDTKEVWVSYPGISGFEVKVASLSRNELRAMRKKCTYNRMNRKTHMLEEELDDEKFVVEFSKATVKGWKGLTVGNIGSLVLVDTGDADKDTEIEYSESNAELLVSSSTEFDKWLNDTVFDLENFRN